jgi:hypothetical protein
MEGDFWIGQPAQRNLSELLRANTTLSSGRITSTGSVGSNARKENTPVKLVRSQFPTIAALESLCGYDQSVQTET